MGNVLTKTDPDPLDYVTTYSYGSLYNPTQVIDTAGNTTNYTYDTKGNLLSVSKAVYGGTAITSFAYNDYGQVTGITDANCKTTHFSYDQYGNKATVTDPLNNTTSYTYDIAGRMLTKIDPLGHTTPYTYNATRNVLTVTDPLGNVTANTYDSRVIWYQAPDVALNAGAGNATYIDGSLGGMIGTSISSPCWAGMVAVMNQALQAAGKPPAGSLNPTLYPLGRSASYSSVFHDVYIGNNDTLGGTGSYYAATGWDPVTGWGTPDFQSLMNYMVNLAPNYAPVLTASPTALPPSYPDNTVITVTGTNTHFGSGTSVYMTYNGVQYVKSFNVISPTKLTFTLAAGLPTGTGCFYVDDSIDGHMSVSVDVGIETATISPDNLALGYGLTTINITGANSYFQSGSTTVEVVYESDQSPAIDLSPSGPVVDASVTSTSLASFNLPAGLAAGQYDVVVNDLISGTSLSVPLNVKSPATTTVTASPASVQVNGTSTITATVTSTDGSPLSGATLTFSSDLGTLASSTGVTNAQGQCTNTITSSQTGTATVTATTASGISGSATVVFSTVQSPGGGGGPASAPVAVPPVISPPVSTNTSATATVDETGSVVATADNSVSLNIPAGSFSGMVQVSLNIVPTAQAYNTSGNFAEASPVWSIGTGGIEPVKPVSVTFHYDPASLGGLSSSRLGIYLYDPAQNTWSWVGGKVNTSNDTISANLTRLCIYSVLVNKATFTDMDKESWSKQAVDTLLGANIVSGVAPGTFDPDGILTRAQFTALLVKAKGLDLTDYEGAKQFKDVDPSSWYAPFVAAAYKSGLVAGTSPTSFDPDAPITREEMAIMLSRVLESGSVNGTYNFTDASAIDGWARDGVTKAVSSGLLVGFSDGTFQPASLANRAQAAAAVTKYLSYTGKI